MFGSVRISDEASTPPTEHQQSLLLLYLSKQLKKIKKYENERCCIRGNQQVQHGLRLLRAILTCDISPSDLLSRRKIEYG